MIVSMRATLVQDIPELQEYLRPYLEPLLEQFASHGVVWEDTLAWIIREELEQIYGLFDTTHLTQRSNELYLAIYAELKTSLPLPLSHVVAHYVVAPKLYNDYNLIETELRGRDLHIHYMRNPYDPPAAICSLSSQR